MQFDQLIQKVQQSASQFSRAFDQFFTRLAQHPFMDKIEHLLLQAYSSSAKGIRWLQKLVRPVTHNEKLRLYIQLVRLDRPIGTLLLLWPTLMALWIAAGGWPDTKILIIFLLGTLLMRSAGCAINDYADRDIDNKVWRTKQRPLTSGKISEKETLIIFAVLSFCSFLLVLFLNTLTIWMSVIGLALAASYPFMKRYHYLPQIHLGAAFGWAVPMAFTAQSNTVTPMTWLLFMFAVLWATVYDTMYAMADRDDDIKIGVKSTAILFGPADKLIIGIIQLLMIFNLFMIGERAKLSGFYYAGVCAAIVLSAWQQYLIRDRDPKKCIQAFLNNNWLGCIVFIALFCDYQFGGLR